MTSVLRQYLYVLSILQLGLVLSLLVLQSVFFGFDKVFIVATVTVEPLGVQVDDVCNHGVQEVSVVRHDQDGGLPRLWEEEHEFSLLLVSSWLTFASVYNEEC